VIRVALEQLRERVRAYVGTDLLLSDGSALREKFGAIMGQLYYLRDQVSKPEPSPTATMLVLAEREDPDTGRGQPISMGCVVRIGETRVGAGATLEVTPQYPLVNARAMVFCDLERVAVRGVFRGTEELVTADYSADGSVPIAFVGRILPGTKLRAIVERIR
jgi:hypothetical protein